MDAERIAFVEHIGRSRLFLWSAVVATAGLLGESVVLVVQNRAAIIPDWLYVAWVVARNISMILAAWKCRVYFSNFGSRRQSAVLRLTDARDFAILIVLMGIFLFPWPYGVALGLILATWGYLQESFLAKSLPPPPPPEDT